MIEYITGYVLIGDKYKKVKADVIYFLKKGNHHKYLADKKEPFDNFLNVSGTFAREIASLYGLSKKYIFENKKLRSPVEWIP